MSAKGSQDVFTLEGIERQAYLASEAHKLRRAGKPLEQIVEALRGLNRLRCTPQLLDNELLRIAEGRIATKTPAQINKLNRDFNDSIAGPFQRLMGGCPARLLRPDGIAELRTSAADHVELMKQAQSERARKPRRGDQLRKAVVDTMRCARQDGQTLEAFLEAAEAGSVRGCTVKRGGPSADSRVIECAELHGKSKTVTYRTLETWWTEAGKPPD